MVSHQIIFKSVFLLGSKIGVTFIIHYWFIMPQIYVVQCIFNSWYHGENSRFSYCSKLYKVFEWFFWQYVLSNKKVYMTCVVLCFQFCIIKKLFLVTFLCYIVCRSLNFQYKESFVFIFFNREKKVFERKSNYWLVSNYVIGVW